MSTSSKPYCLMPWIHLHVGQAGEAKLCCVANIPLGNVNERSVDEIWNGSQMQEVRKRFVKGGSDPRCAVCINCEKGGAKSIRQETFEKFNVNSFRVISEKLPVYFDIRFSNVCNFSCRTCWHGASSSWFKDAKALGREAAEQAIINNIDDVNLFIERWGTALRGAEEIYFAGGEPLVTEAHYVLLQWLIDNGRTQMRLRYNTNFSHLLFKGIDVLELWKQFAEVELLASVDDFEKNGEYIRTGFDWEQFVVNRAEIRKSEVDFKLAPTVSVFNLEALIPYYKRAIAEQIIKWDGLYINLLDRPYHYSIKAFPAEQKKEITAQFETFNQWLVAEDLSAMIPVFQQVVDFMNAEDKSAQWTKFHQEVRLLDRVREAN